MTAKPQQMSGQATDPDDLIAELTKLMAADGRPPHPESASGQKVAAPQMIRIPGIREPVPSAVGLAASGAAPAVVPEPQPGWRDRLAGPSAAAESGSALRQEPSFGRAMSRPAAAPATAARNAAPAFDFDFGFNRPAPQSASPEPARAMPVAVAPSRVATPSHDAIADLIAAELDGGPAAAPGGTEPSPANSPAPKPQPVALRPAIPAPPPVKMEPAAPAMVPVAATQASRAAPESDRFIAAPVFGLGNRPVGEAPGSRHVDPMDEIEGLIGEAVRVDLNPPAKTSQPAVEPVAELPARPTSAEAQPSVPPLSTQFAPRRSSLREAPTAADADDAVLAAVAAGGGAVPVESAYAEERPAAAVKRKRQRQRRNDDDEQQPRGGAFRNFVVPVIAGTVLVAIGFGLYFALGMGNHHAAHPPILTADATPSKTIPPKPADTAPRSVVMDELSGTAPAAGQENLVSRDQTNGADGAQVAAADPAPAANGGLANRKVRTVTVRPDGTIITSDDSVAGAAELPVSRPNVPSIPGVSVAEADSTPPSSMASAAGQGIGAPMNAASVAPAAASAPVAAVSPVSTPVPAAAHPDPNAPVPMARSLRPQATLVADASEDMTLPAPVAAKPVTAKGKSLDPIANLLDGGSAAPREVASADSSIPTTVPGAVAHVQLSSQPTPAAAQASASALERKYGSLFNGAHLAIVKVELGGKGVRYRVEMPASSLAGARQLCSSIKANGGDCFAGNG